MFNIKSIVRQITERSKDQSTESADTYTEDSFSQKTEGFLCPKCMKQLPSPWELRSHYESVHDEENSDINMESSTGVVKSYKSPEDESDRCSSDQNVLVCGDVKNSSVEVEVPLLTDVCDLQERLQQALNRKATLESRVVHLVQSNVTLKAAVADMDRELSQLRERHKILEAQVAHRESIDDAAVLRQELVQVQRVMDEMNREREKERDELQAKLQQLQESDSHPKIDILKTSLHLKEQECLKLVQEMKELKTKYECGTSKLSKENSTGLASGHGTVQIPAVDHPEDVTTKADDLASVHDEACIKCDEQEISLCSSRDSEVVKISSDGKKSVNSSVSEIRDLMPDHNELKEELVKKGEELTRILCELKMTKQSMVSQNEKMKAMDEQQKALREMLSCEKKACADLTVELKTLSVVKSQIENDLQNSLKECSVAQRTVTDLQQSVLEFQHEYKNVQSEHEQKFESLQLILEEKCNLLQKQEDAVHLLVTERTELVRQLELMETEKVRLSEETSLLLEKLQKQLVQSSETQKHLEDRVLSETKKSHYLQDQLKTLTESSNSTVEEKSEEIKTLSAALDETTGEKLALEANLEASGIEQQKLLERCYASTHEIETLQHTVAELRRKWEESESALQDLGRENATLHLDIEKLLARKWTEDSDVTQCTLCHREFTMLLRKHHCRNCGQIFCNECSSKTAAVVSNKKPVRVCDSCYTELREN